MKACRLCGEVKSLDDFHKQASSADGRQPRCKTCAIALARKHYRDNKDRHKILNKLWKERNADKVREIRHRHRVRTRYGLSWDEYQALVAFRGEVCWICGTDDPQGGRQFMSVDHDHATGEVRGLLCDSCNNGLARFRDDVAVMRAAMEYLRETA